ncbi:MAG: MATE family efflux transporter [Acetanaerobacterium sp.]
MFSRKDLTRLIIPLIIEQVFAATIGIADTLMVAKVGEAAVSGVALVDAVNMLLIGVFAALATGGAIITAQYLGREDKDGANRSAKQLFLITVLLSAVITVVSFAANRPILSLLYGAVEPEVMQNARSYYYLSALSYPFIAAFNACAALFRSMNNSRVSMFASGLMNIVNVAGNALFIFGFGMGVAGAGLASLIARALGAVVLFILLSRKPRYIIHFEKMLPLRLEFDTIKNILRIGIPSGLENGIFQIGKILVQGIVTSFGTAAIAANAVAASVTSVAMMPGSAIGMAAITVVGQCIGAHDYKQAAHYMKKMVIISQMMVAAINILMAVFMGPILSLYDLGPESVSLARQMVLCTAILGALFWSVSFILPSGLRAANDVKFTMVTAIVSMWVFRLGGGYVFANVLGFGVIGVWIGMGADWIFRCIMFIMRYVTGKWKHRQII